MHGTVDTKRMGQCIYSGSGTNAGMIFRTFVNGLRTAKPQGYKANKPIFHLFVFV